MVQGDQYNLPISLTVGGAAFDFTGVEKIEFAVDKMLRSYPNNVSYDAGTNVFLFPLTQSETFCIKCKKIPIQARIKYMNGNVIGSETIYTEVGESISKVVL